MRLAMAPSDPHIDKCRRSCKRLPAAYTIAEDRKPRDRLGATKLASCALAGCQPACARINIWAASLLQLEASCRRSGIRDRVVGGGFSRGRPQRPGGRRLP